MRLDHLLSKEFLRCKRIRWIYPSRLTWSIDLGLLNSTISSTTENLQRLRRGSLGVEKALVEEGKPGTLLGPEGTASAAPSGLSKQVKPDLSEVFPKGASQ